MRNIKFRAWVKHDESSGRGLMVCAGDKSDYTMISNGDGFSVVEDFDNYLKDYQFEIMQFTGLQDKSRLDIYEGDILSVNFDDEDAANHVVEFSNGGYWIEIPYCDYDQTSLNFAESDSYAEFEIIGNIHENPELIESKEISA